MSWKMLPLYRLRGRYIIMLVAGCVIAYSITRFLPNYFLPQRPKRRRPRRDSSQEDSPSQDGPPPRRRRLYRDPPAIGSAPGESTQESDQAQDSLQPQQRNLDENQGNWNMAPHRPQDSGSESTPGTEDLELADLDGDIFALLRALRPPGRMVTPSSGTTPNDEDTISTIWGRSPQGRIRVPLETDDGEFGYEGPMRSQRPLNLGLYVPMPAPRSEEEREAIGEYRAAMEDIGWQPREGKGDNVTLEEENLKTEVHASQRRRRWWGIL